MLLSVFEAATLTITVIIACARLHFECFEPVTVVSIKAGDSTRFKPKYSDVSGLTARYRDPKTGLLYATKDECA